MEIDAIVKQLNTRFAAPLPEFYRRRIIFWYDEDREFEDKLDEIQLENARLVTLTGNNNFSIKKLLCSDDTIGNYLVYSPLSFQRDDDNWLINVQLFSEEFRADLNSIWMDEMGLPSTPIIRAQVKSYRKFFNARSRREALKKLNKDIKTASHMHLAVMAALCGNKDTDPNSILRAVLMSGLDMDNNSVYQSFVTYGADKAFWVMTAQATGYSEGEESDLGRLAVHILLTAATRTMHKEHLAGLDSYISMPHQAYCYDFVSDWLHSDSNDRLYEIARFAEHETKLQARFEKLSTDDLVNTECFPGIDECILAALMKEIADQIIDVDTIRSVVEKRRTFAWYDRVSCYYDGLLQVANMQAFFLEHSAGFHMVEPTEIWKAYTTDYYKMDSYYRRFHLCFQKCLTDSDPLLDDLFKHVTEKVEGLYSHWFLGQLGQNWSMACEDELKEYGKIFEVPQQTDFYRGSVKYADTRVFVIVSDALRYEVAVALAEQLRRETQSKVTLNSMQAVLPSITKFGMAALLPYQKLTVSERANGQLSVLADDIPTDAGYRDKILKQANKNSVALKYTDMIAMKSTDRKALVKGMEVVYIYHDKIDEASHTSDTAVFPACDDAIQEIKNLVRIIVREFSGIRIFITADHGFLYTYSPLKEDDKLDKSGFVDHAVEYGRRYAILQKGANPDYLLPVKFLGGNTDYDLYAPRENIRIKQNGGGLNFVHGGFSLQEMVVPLIDYRYLRTDSRAYQNNKDKIDTKPVKLSLLSAGRKISNMIFSLNFYQTEAVGDNREAAVYLLYFEDAGGNRISDTNKIIADKTSDNGQERTFRCSFNLRSQSYSSQDTYYLVIADETGLQAPQKEEFQINIAFAIDDFNFFS